MPVVYDSIGKDTFPASLDCLSPRGMFVSFGNSSGPVAAFDLGLLSQKGSLYATRPTLFTYAGTRRRLVAMAAELFDRCARARSRRVRQTFARCVRRKAHRELESRATTGATVLLP